MTDASIAVIVAAIPTTIGSITAAILAYAAYKKANEAKTVITSVASDTAVVLGHVNSQKSIDATTIAFQERENKLLRETIADRDRVAGLLAQSNVQLKGAPVVMAPAFVVPPNDAPDASHDRRKDDPPSDTSTEKESWK
jgi:hypothetical protein